MNHFGRNGFHGQVREAASGGGRRGKKENQGKRVKEVNISLGFGGSGITRSSFCVGVLVDGAAGKGR